MSLVEWPDTLRCPEHDAPVAADTGGLRCAMGHAIPLRDGIPFFASSEQANGRDERWARFYDLWAPFYDLSERFFTRTLFGLDVIAERERIVRHLGLRPGVRLLEISPGPGVYQQLLLQAIGPEGRLAELDLSSGMLRECSRRARKAGDDPLLVQANAAGLPFADASFDVVFHFGGVKLFTDPARALAEMVRVAKPGGSVAWGDEGFGAGAPTGWRRRLLERVNPGFLEPRPAVPDGLRVEANHEVMNGCAWLVVARRTDSSKLE